jgi:Leucine-rich repeat (LRR) protein
METSICILTRLIKIPLCPSVSNLLLADNRIEVIDIETLEIFSNLTHLDLSNNEIKMVPPRLGMLNLTYLGLMGNIFRVPRPYSIANTGTYYREELVLSWSI